MTLGTAHQRPESRLAPLALVALLSAKFPRCYPRYPRHPRSAVDASFTTELSTVIDQGRDGADPSRITVSEAASTSPPSPPLARTRPTRFLRSAPPRDRSTGCRARRSTVYSSASADAGVRQPVAKELARFRRSRSRGRAFEASVGVTGTSELIEPGEIDGRRAARVDESRDMLGQLSLCGRVETRLVTQEHETRLIHDAQQQAARVAVGKLSEW